MKIAACLMLTTALATALASCSGLPNDVEDAGPPLEVFAVVLGTAQDGGLPQVGCFDECCADAREDPELRRLVSSVLIVDARGAGPPRRWLLDCTPDLQEQVASARGVLAPRTAGDGGRPPLFDGIFPTHAHLGHYAGLLQLGREAYGAKGQRVFATERMERFLLGNDPFAHLVESGALVLERIAPGDAITLAPDLVVEPLSVPHRDEFSDTVAFVVRGPEGSLCYLPDIDKWERWDTAIEDVVRGVDVALLDGTFFADGEIPGRSMRDIPHPFIAESIARFRRLEPSERARIWFTHLNHTNPVARPGSVSEAAVLSAGMHVARDGQVFRL